MWGEICPHPSVPGEMTKTAKGSSSSFPQVSVSRRGDRALSYLHRCFRRRSRTPTRGTHTRVRSTRPARSRDRCRHRSHTGPGRGTECPLGVAPVPGTGAPIRPGRACTGHQARFCMGWQTTARPWSGTDTAPTPLSPCFLPLSTQVATDNPWGPTFLWGPIFL